jgi:hypothetical protein
MAEGSKSSITTRTQWTDCLSKNECFGLARRIDLCHDKGFSKENDVDWCVALLFFCGSCGGGCDDCRRLSFSGCVALGGEPDLMASCSRVDNTIPKTLRVVSTAICHGTTRYGSSFHS